MMTQSTRSCILRLTRQARNGLSQSGTGGLSLTSSPSSSETGLSYDGEIQLHKFIDKPNNNEISICAHNVRPLLSIIIPEYSGPIFSNRLARQENIKLFTINKIIDDRDI